jgi:RNA polymerase sigma factor (sigma-70 family)
MLNTQQLEISGSDVAALVTRACEGDQASWEALVDRFASMVMAVARRCGLNTADAADVSQTTWLRLFEHLDRIEQPERVGGWLATTARRESLRLTRMSGRQISTESDEFTRWGDPPAPAPEASLMNAERNDALSAIFAELPHRCQCILRPLAGGGEMSYEDLGRLLDMPIGSIGPTRARCLERLRRLATGLGLSVSDGAA